LISCKKDKKENPSENNTNIEKNVENVRKNIELSNLIYYSKFDGVKNEGDYEDYYGTYANDRFDFSKKALFLDGISDYGKIENIKLLNSKEHISISIWYKPDSYKGNGNNIIISKSDLKDETFLTQYGLSSIGNQYPKIPGTFKLSFSIDGVLNTIKTKENVWQPDNWYLLTGTYDGTKMNLYVNGELKAGRKISGKIDVYDVDLFLGKTPGKELFTSGTFDDLKIFDRALTKKEIMQLYENK